MPKNFPFRQTKPSLQKRLWVSTIKYGLITVQKVSLACGNSEVSKKDSCFSGAQTDYTIQVSTGIGNANVSDSAGGSKKMFLSTGTGISGSALKYPE